ncbi:MAG TPA: hypothetical protein VES62_09295, partial [Thermoleophilaceae bacterium]|nr:hypothetical protein [Thermoleophilaceae bacterium]
MAKKRRSGAGQPAPSRKARRSGAGQPAPSRKARRSGAGQPAPSRKALPSRRKRPVEYSILYTATLCLLAAGAVMVYSASS